MSTAGSEAAIPAGVRLADTAPVTLTAPELAAAIGAENDSHAAERLLAVACEMVRRYAPAAPSAMANEATIRFAGYLHGSDYGGVASEEIGPRKVEYTANHSGAWRNSGAGMLLSPWRVRRAGLAG